MGGCSIGCMKTLYEDLSIPRICYHPGPKHTCWYQGTVGNDICISLCCINEAFDSLLYTVLSFVDILLLEIECKKIECKMSF